MSALGLRGQSRPPPMAIANEKSEAWGPGGPTVAPVWAPPKRICANGTDADMSRAGAAFPLEDQDVSIRLLGLAGAVVLGYFVPEQVLVSLRKRHRLSLMAALPDTTDMLSIVLGAGLSLDQAIARVGEEIRFVYPELADEFYWMTLEVQAGQGRAVAFPHMAQRTGLLDIRSLATMIVQAERFGTGLSQALRIYADSLRTKPRLEIQATINKAAVKMVFPIVLFVLPALFVVILAPGIISTLRDLQLLR